MKSVTLHFTRLPSCLEGWEGELSLLGGDSVQEDVLETGNGTRRVFVLPRLFHYP